MALALWALAAPVWGQGWGPLRAWKARRTIGIPPADAKQPKMRGKDCCFVRFPTGGLLQPDGADLRVTVGGQPIPFKVIDIGFGGVVSLAAPVPETTDRLVVYYGNPAAKPLKSTWTPRRGVWLETRHYKGGDCTSLTGMREAIAASDPRYGAGPVAQIFHGHNPFGPADNYLSLYTGWLYVAKDTTITFAAIADDVGYVFVEDKLVAAKKKWGAMPRQHFSGEPMLLKQGIHPIRMLHVEGTARQAAGVAWWMPGMKRGKKYLHFQVIPVNAYAPIRYAKLLNYEIQGQPVAADISAVNDGDVLLDNKSMLVRFVFRDGSRPGNRALQCEPLWQFGDGTSSTSRDPTHVYLRPDDYTVTLTLRGKDGAYSVKQQVRAGPAYERATRRAWDKLAQYAPILLEYQFEKMATEDLVVAARAFEELEDAKGIIATCRVLVSRGDALDDAGFVRHSLLLGRRLRDYRDEEEENPEAEARKRIAEALEAFTRAEQRTKDVHARARLANEKGDVYYYFLNDLERAQQEYTKTLTTYVAAADAQVRVAQMRIGDLYRTKGDRPAALKAYQRAADMPIDTRTEKVEVARRGSFPRTIEDYTRRKLFTEAHKALDEWDWEFPTDKLVGYSSLLRARLALAEDNTEEAAKQAEELVGASKESEYADDLLLLLVDVRVGEGKLDAAFEAASRLLDGYPASELQEQAHLKRANVRLLQAKHDEAAAEAIALADANKDSELAPQALFLAASAQRRAGKPDEATKILERLTQTYPTTDEATRGLAILKELRRK